MTLHIRQMEEEDARAWDCYVAAHKDGTFCHRAGWKNVLEKGAGQNTQYLLAQEGDAIVGVLPLSVRNSFLFGKAVISNMLAVYGGTLADSHEITQALSQEAWNFAQSKGVDILEFRTIKKVADLEGNWVTDEASATFQKTLKETEEGLLLDIPRKQRAVVRKSLKAGLACTWEKDIDGFYRLYAESLRNLGTPVFPKAIFEELLKNFGDDVEIQLIFSPKGDAVASLMSFYHGNVVLPYYAGGSRQARDFGAHDYMYYMLMLRALKRGKKRFDFGRSKVGSGPYRFKKNWGFEPTPLQYQTRLAPGIERPDLSTNNKKFDLMIKLWRKLPLPVANVLGPPLARHLG